MYRISQLVHLESAELGLSEPAEPTAVPEPAPVAGAVSAAQQVPIVARDGFQIDSSPAAS